MRRAHVPALTLLFWGLLFTAPAMAAGLITSGETAAGAFMAPNYSETWWFSGTAGDRVLISAVTTSGAANTFITLYPPVGPAVQATSSDRVDYQLTQTGTWTFTVEDQGLNDVGSYGVGLLNVTAGPLTNGGDLDGGPIASGSIATGSAVSACDFDAFTFSATSGDRVLITGLATSGAYNTAFWLYPPGGGFALSSTFGDRIDITVNATGTWTVVMQDAEMDSPGTYTLAVLDVTAGPWTNGSDLDGGVIASGEHASGQFDGLADWDVFRFTGTAGDRILFNTLLTSGTANTMASLYPPGGGGPVQATSSDRIDYQLTLSGTWTMVVEDAGQNDTGTYDVGFQNLTSGPLTTGLDPDGGPIVSGQVLTGQMNGTCDWDAFTFFGTLDDRVVVAGVATGGVGFNTHVWLYPPAGAPALSNTFGDRLDVKLNATGTWTIVIQDADMDTPGSYSVSFLNVTSGPYTTPSDPDSASMSSGETAAGTANGLCDFDAFRITGNAGDRILFNVLRTSGTAILHTTVYPPGGGGAVQNTTAARIDYQLPQSGTYTFVIEDAALTAAGTYSLGYLNVTSGPLTTFADPDGGPIVSGEIESGQANGTSDFDAFTFSGNNGDRVLVGCVATGGAGFNTNFWIYPPAGGPGLASTFGDRLDVKLTSTGTWTVVVQDADQDTPGSYAISVLDVTSGPWTTGADTDGAPIGSNDPTSGQTNAVCDFDAFQFTGHAGDRVLIGCLPTSGLVNLQASIYPPGGGGAELMTASDRLDIKLLQSGTYTIVVEDLALTQTGSYALGLVNVTAGPWSTPGDPDGDTIHSDEIASAQVTGLCDFDAYPFEAQNGDRILMSAVKTDGSALNTLMYLYPPGGGTAAASSYSDRLEFKATSTGTWTLVVQDAELDSPGAYNTSILNVSGPMDDPYDTDSGILLPGVPRNGQANASSDFDGWYFYGLTGDNVTITATTTVGPMDTYISLYPPGGGVPLNQTATDVVNRTLPADGLYRVVIEDNGQNDTGSYTVTMTGSGATSGVDTPGEAPDLRPLVLAGASPSPFAASTRIAFRLGAPGNVRLSVFDARGALVRSLADGLFDAGDHEVAWDGRDESGRTVAGGVYYYGMSANGERATGKVVKIGG